MVKQSIFLAILIFLLTPSIVFSAWWNPLTWQIFKKEQANIIQPTQATSTVSIEDLSKKIEELEKRLQEGISKSKEKLIIQNKESEIVTQPNILTEKEIIKNVSPAVVFIDTKSGSGSGSIIDKEGYILTNAHVVGKYNQVSIVLSTGLRREAVLVGIHEPKDLAILKISSTGITYPFVKINYFSGIEQGDKIYLFGFPLGLQGDKGSSSLVDGIVSRVREDYIETNLNTKPGNSGGPVVNSKAELIAVHTQEYTAGSVMEGTGIKEAINIASAREIIPKILEGMKLYNHKISSETELAFRGWLKKIYDDTKEDLELKNAISSRDENLFNFLNGQLILGKYDEVAKNYYNQLESSANKIYFAVESLKAQSISLEEFLNTHEYALSDLNNYQQKILNQIESENSRKRKEYDDLITVWSLKRKEITDNKQNWKKTTSEYLMERDREIQAALEYLKSEKQRIISTFSADIIGLF